MIWSQRPERALARLIASLKSLHPQRPYKVIKLAPDTHAIKGLLEKSRMMELSPFEETLYLDADTVVLDRLDFGFEQAARFGVACCICECPWARRYRGLPNDDGIEYNTGVLFFNRGAQALFQRWHELESVVEPAIDFIGPNGQPAVMPFDDQGGFAKAVREWEQVPFILPHNWNFRPAWHRTFFGPIKIWHDYSDPPPQLAQLNASYRRPGAIVQFHAPIRAKD
jgi:hypothetical protein